MVKHLSRLVIPIRMVVEILQSVVQSVRKLRLALILSRTPGCTFTTDWVSSFAEDWEQVLKEIRGNADIRMLEIGSYEGRSAIWFLETILTSPSASIVCVDPFTDPSPEMRFDHNISASGLQVKVTKLKGYSEAVVPTLPSHAFDLAYVDGSHRAVNVLMDGVLAWNRLKPGGFMIFDDYLWDLENPLPAHERPRMAIDIFLEVFEAHIEILLKEYQVIIRKRS